MGIRKKHVKVANLPRFVGISAVKIARCRAIRSRSSLSDFGSAFVDRFYDYQREIVMKGLIS